jgi:membrane protein implicated in regulation of membrane protease activity
MKETTHCRIMSILWIIVGAIVVSSCIFGNPIIMEMLFAAACISAATVWDHIRDILKENTDLKKRVEKLEGNSGCQCGPND